MIAILVYHELFALGKLVGFTNMPPALGKPFFHTLVASLMTNQRYDEARRVAVLGRLWHPDLSTTETLRLIVATPGLQPILYAKAYMDLADCLAQQDGGAPPTEYESTLKTAEWFYQQSSHRFGSLLVRAKLLQRGVCSGTPAEHIEELYSIESELETYGAWNDVTGCIKAIIDLGQREFVYVSDSIQPRFEHMLGSMRQNGCSAVVVNLLDMARHMLWLKGGANVGTTLASLEGLLTAVSAMEAPTMKFLAAQTLHDSYRKLGNTRKAAEVADQLPGLIHPRVAAIFGYDDFFQRVQKETESKCSNSGDGLSDMSSLQADLWRVRQLMGTLYDNGDKEAQVQRLCNLCNLYVRQGEVHDRARQGGGRMRDINETEQLIEVVLTDVAAYTAQLPPPASITWVGHAIQVRARLQYLRNDTAANTDQKLYHLGIAVNLNNQAIAMYDGAQLPLLSATARQQLAVCHKTLWRLRGDNSGSEESDLSRAAALHLEAKDILERCGELELNASRLNARQLLGVWVSAHTTNIPHLRVRRWTHQGKHGQTNTVPSFASTILNRPIIEHVLKRSKLAAQVLETMASPRPATVAQQPGVETFSTLQKCLDGLADLDFLSDMDRDDISVVADRRDAIAARQELHKLTGSREMFDVAFQIFDYIRDLPSLWRWVQKSKARSLSDQLGLGVKTILPAEVKDRLARNPEAQWRLQEEANLVAAIQAECTKPNSGNSVFLRQRLYQMRREHRNSNPVVSEVLDFREGQPLSLDRVVQVVGTIPRIPGTEGRSIVFVDWVVINERYCVMLQKNGQLYNYQTSFTVDDSKNWKMDFGKVMRRADTQYGGPEMALLRRLSPLLQPIGQLSQPGDLLVFSPSQELFCVPLHAATLDTGTDTMYIEKYPIVYGHSTTTSCHCITREIWSRKPRPDGPRDTHRAIAVYEEDDHRNPWSTQQKSAIYGEVTDALELPAEDKLKFGAGVTKADITDGLGRAAILTLIGHCDGNDNKLLQSIRLPTTEFTAADALGLESNEKTPATATSLLLLLACGSANEGRDEMDEPTGLISSFLCGGVSSVVGTMWNVRLKTVAWFAALMRSHIQEEMSRSQPGGLIDLAVVFQRCVLELRENHDVDGLLYHWAPFALHGSWVMNCC